MIQKAITFWNHPALRDVPSTEKRSYLNEHQGLTNAQIHKVWEGMVGTPRVGMDNNINNRPDSNSTGDYNVTAPQQFPRRHQHQYNNDQSSSDPPTNATNGQHLNSNEAPYTLSSGSKYDHDYKYHMMGGRHHLYSPPLNDNHSMEGDDGLISIARGLSLLGMGGFLGVTGAAAVRWLNGGRFELLPPHATTDIMNALGSTSTSSRKEAFDKQQTQEQASFNLQQQTYQYRQGECKVGEHADEKTHWNIDRDNKNEYDEENEYNDEECSDNDDQFDVEGHLIERIDALLSSIESNSVLHERLILKLSNTSSITDDSMNLLKQKIGSNNHSNNNNDKANNQQSTTGSSDSNTVILAQLKDIKDDLASFCGSMTNDLSSKNGDGNPNNEDCRNKWSELLSKFENCIQAIKRPIDSFVVDPGAADSKSACTSETTATENQGPQDTRSSTAAPSTPSAATNDRNQIISSATAIISIPLSLRDCILKIVEKNDTVSLKSGSQLLYLYLANLSGKPDNRRYRKIYTSNESFQKVEDLNGGKDLLHAVGFVEEGDKGILEWVPTGCTDEVISALNLVKEAAAALGILKKPDNVPSPELVRSALSKLSSPYSSISVSNQSSLQPRELGDNRHHTYYDQDDIPQTPSGSSLLSPPMPKKLPFVPTPSDRS